MLQECQIYIDRLKEGKELQIEETVSSKFLEVDDDSLSFRDDVKIRGKVYLTDEYLILQLSITTKALLPCIICNEMKETPVEIDEFYHGELITQIKDKIFNFTEKVRDAILLEVPLYYECNSGNCPKRDEIKSYFKKENSANPIPFSDDLGNL